jgi:hypothetical protein
LGRGKWRGLCQDVGAWPEFAVTRYRRLYAGGAITEQLPIGGENFCGRAGGLCSCPSRSETAMRGICQAGGSSHGGDLSGKQPLWRSRHNCASNRLSTRPQSLPARPFSPTKLSFQRDELVGDAEAFVRQRPDLPVVSQGLIYGLDPLNTFPSPLRGAKGGLGFGAWQKAGTWVRGRNARSHATAGFTPAGR